MTQEEKQLLLKDLCGRLQYKVKLGFENSNLILVPKEFNIYTMKLSTNQIYPKFDNMVIGHIYNVWDYRPYLRPMSSMTEDEKLDYIALGDIKRYTNPQYAYLISEQLDYLNAHYFDYRGLIPMGFALEAPKDMYDR